MNTIRLFDPADLDHLLGTHNPAFDDCPALRMTSSDETRDKDFKAIRDSPLGCMRPLAVGTTGMLQRLDDLLAIAPHFSDALGVISRAACLSAQAHTGLSVPPLLLLGPPGVGKTFLARRLAAAIGVPFAEYSFAQGDDPGVLTGHSLSWRAARPGIIAKTLLENDSASPVIFIDEIDKATALRDEDPTDCLHALLEPENATRSSDQYYELPMQAQHVIWVLTANDITSLRPSLLDRMLVITILEPTQAQQLAVVRSIYDAVIKPYIFVMDHEPDGPVLARLSTLAPRTVRRVLQLALPFAVADGRRRLTPRDIESAKRLVSPAPTRCPIGFMANNRI